MPPSSSSAMSEAIRRAYTAGQEDETLEPLVRIDETGAPVGRMQRGDAVVFYNIRGEGEVELCRSLTEQGFSHFPVVPLELHYGTMIEYDPRLDAAVAFPPEGEIGDTLSEVLARQGLRQVKITEAVKAIPLAFFLNGKRGTAFPGENRIVVPTRKDVALFDEAPEMSLDGVAAAVSEQIAQETCQVIVANFPNVDVVGHIENEGAIVRALEAVDTAAGRVVAQARRAGITVVVTADHGTVEKWLYPDGAVDTGHTDSPVPFAVITPDGPIALRAGGGLIDVAPTVLDLLGIPKPTLMTGSSLLWNGFPFLPGASCS